MIILDEKLRNIEKCTHEYVKYVNEVWMNTDRKKSNHCIRHFEKKIMNETFANLHFCFGKEL